MHVLVKINMMRYINLTQKSGQISKDEFESMLMFLSSYNKAKDMNGTYSLLWMKGTRKMTVPAYYSTGNVWQLS